MSNIEQRAARYFGLSRYPRTSIKVGRYKVVTVVPHGKSRSVSVYSEEGREPSGHYLYFEGGVPSDLIEALR